MTTVNICKIQNATEGRWNHCETVSHRACAARTHAHRHLTSIRGMFLNETSFGAGPRDRTLLLGDFGTRDDLSNLITNFRLQHQYRVGKKASIKYGMGKSFRPHSDYFYIITLKISGKSIRRLLRKYYMVWQLAH